MKVCFNLTEEQNRFLNESSGFDINDWFNTALNKKINELNSSKEKINVIIVAAGRSTCLSRDGDETPKAMLKIKGKSILERQIEMLKLFNINDITVVRGYRKEQFKMPGVNYIDNNEYEKTGILYSFHLASEKIVGKTILLYGDILFDKWIIEKLIMDDSDFAVLVDRSWQSHYHNRADHTISEAELVEVRDDSICCMGLGIPYENAYGEFIGLAAISGRGAAIVKNFFQETSNTSDKELMDNDHLSKASLTALFNSLIEKKIMITPIDISGGWIEIDTFEDFRKSWTMVK